MGEVGAVKPVLALQQNIFTDRSRAVYSFMDHLCFLCLAFLMLSRLYISALWSPAG